jgi:hypothetical protein
MEETINERIGKIIDTTDKSLNAFAKRIGIAQTSLRDCVKNDAEPKFSTLHKIIKAEPLINPNWLLIGSGEMFVNKKNPIIEHEPTFHELLLENRNLRIEIDKLKSKIDRLEEEKKNGAE